MFLILHILYIDESTNSSKKVSCTLKVKIFHVKDLIGRKSSKNEAYVALRLDRQENMTRSKTRSKLSWDEELTIKTENSNELEILVYDQNDGLLAMLAFRLGDLEAQIKEVLTEDPSVEPALESVWDLEPVGQIQMRIAFPKPKRAQSRLQRHAAVKKRRVQIVFGHRFVPAQFYGALKCALCNDFLFVGFQCEACRLLCHRKCQDRVFSKCISRADNDSEANDNLIKSNVPHRFEHASSLIPTWCDHCGYMLPIGKKGFHRCDACSVNCHEDCKIYIPNSCGLSYQRASQMELLARKPGKSESSLARIAGTTPRGSTNALSALSMTPADLALPTDPTAKQASLDDFHFIAVLGKGNFGKVMLAEEKSTKSLYAIKILKKEFILQNDELESTKSEKRVFVAINRARHPFLVGLHSCFQTETRIYFVMEYVNGGDLMLHIQRQQFSEKQAKFYACEVLLALEFFHRHQIIYRDLKLDNILLTAEGHVKLADYGLCKENMGYGATTNTFCGTPEFMAPEILLEQDYDRAVDWWAFGVLIYEMLLGQSPFKGSDEDEIFEAIIEDEVLYPVNMNKDAVSIIQDLLTKNPKKRLGSSPSDAEPIKAHPFFSGHNWNDILRKRVPPPFVPAIGHEKDVSNFDDEFTRELPVLTPIQNQLLETDQAEFKDFNYVADWNSSTRTSDSSISHTSMSPSAKSRDSVVVQSSKPITVVPVPQMAPQSPQTAPLPPQPTPRTQQDCKSPLSRSVQNNLPSAPSSPAPQMKSPMNSSPLLVKSLKNISLDCATAPQGSVATLMGSDTDADSGSDECSIQDK